ncbi:MAG: tryptophan halogenase family protein [Pseudomonadales bacterium]
MNGSISRIVIVGGGSAGWLTAGLLASEHIARAGRDISVTLIESPDVKTIGVGEGTWPTMRATLRKIGISEAEFLLRCSASLKQGTQFVGWVTGDDADRYYHPFSAPAAYTNLNLVPYWQAQQDKVSFVDAVSVQGYLCDRNLAPKQASTPEYAGVVNYGYHLDAGRFSELLREHCTRHLGVRHILDHVTTINGEPDGDIRSLTTKVNGDLEGDLFIDCTGMASLLLGRHYGIRYRDRANILFNDSALAAQVPYPDEADPVASQTISTAQPAGWIWDIGLASRRGIGYTYSSGHTTDEAAEQALRAYIERTTGMPADTIEPRKIAFRPGHREKFWHRNCVAVGMAAGFLEPLEASALVLVELAGKMLSEELPANRQVMDIVAQRYNDVFLYRWDRIIDFLKLHYLLSRRTHSDYWVCNRRPESVPDSLGRLLELWRYHVPWHNDFRQRDEIFPAASYQYVLYGMGFETETRPIVADSEDARQARDLFVANHRKAREIVPRLPSNREFLATVARQGLPTDRPERP